MTAKLLIREVGSREFAAYNGDYNASAEVPGITAADEQATVQYQPPRTAEDNAIAEGERLCAEGNVEAFQVWTLVTTRKRVTRTEEVEA